MSYFKKTIAYLAILSIFWNDLALCMEDSSHDKTRGVVRTSRSVESPNGHGNGSSPRVSSPSSVELLPSHQRSRDSAATPSHNGERKVDGDVRISDVDLEPTASDSSSSSASTAVVVASPTTQSPHLATFLRSIGWREVDLQSTQFPIDMRTLERLAAREMPCCPPRWVTINHMPGNIFYGCCLGRRGVSEPDNGRACTDLDCSRRVCVRGRSIPIKGKRSLGTAVAIDQMREGLEDGLIDGAKLVLFALLLYQFSHPANNLFDVYKRADSTSVTGIAKLLHDQPAWFGVFSIPVALGLLRAVINICQIDEPTREAVNRREAPIQALGEGWWNDYIRPIGLIPPLKRYLSNLERLILWTGELPPDARDAAFGIVDRLAKTRHGYTQREAMRRLARIAHGLHMKDFHKLQAAYSKETLQQVLSMKTRALRTLETLNAQLHRQRGCNYTLINALYSTYLLWSLGHSASMKALIGTSFVKAAQITWKTLFLVLVIRTLDEYLNCPNKPGFSWSGGYQDWASDFSRSCFDALVETFYTFPGQPTATLTDGIPDYHFPDDIYDLDLSGKGLSGPELTDILRGFARNRITVTSFNSARNFANRARDFQTLFPLLSRTTRVNLGESGVEDYYSNSTEADTIALGDTLGNLTTVAEFDVSGNELEFLGFEGTAALARGLERVRTTLRSLNLARNKFGYYGPDGLVSLGRALQNLTRLTDADFSDNLLENAGDSLGTTEIFNNLSPSLTRLRIANARIGAQSSQGVVALATNLPRFTDLIELDLSGNQFIAADSAGFDLLVQNIPFLRNLRIFRIHPQVPGLNSTQVARLNQALRQTPFQGVIPTPFHTSQDVDAYLSSFPSTTTSFDFRGLIGDPSVIPHLMDRLRDFPVTDLDVSDNLMELVDFQGAVPFGNGLRYLTGLRTLKFRGNFIGNWNSDGTRAIGEALANLTSLTHLDGSNNVLGGAGSDGVVTMARNLPPSLRHLDLSRNYIGGTDIQGPLAFGNRTNDLPDLSHIDFSHNPLGVWGPDGFVALFNNLRSLPRSPHPLKRLNLEGTNMGTTSTRETVAFRDALPSFTSLETLLLGFNNVGSHGPQGLEFVALLPELPQFQRGSFAGAKGIGWTETAQILAELSNKRLRLACEAEICTGNPVNSRSTESQPQEPLAARTSLRARPDTVRTASAPRVRPSTASSSNTPSSAFAEESHSRTSFPSDREPFTADDGPFSDDFFTDDGFAPSRDSVPPQTSAAYSIEPFFIFKLFRREPALPSRDMFPPLLHQRNTPSELPLSPSKDVVLTQRAHPSESQLTVEDQSCPAPLPQSPSPLWGSATKGALCTFVPEMVREACQRVGAPKVVTVFLTRTTQVGAIIGTVIYFIPQARARAVSLFSTATGIGVTEGLQAIRVPAPISIGLGNTAALAVAIFSGDVITPAKLALSMTGGLLGSGAAATVSHAIWHPKQTAKSCWKAVKVVAHGVCHPRQTARSSWNYVKSSRVVTVPTKIISSVAYHPITVQAARGTAQVAKSAWGFVTSSLSNLTSLVTGG